MALKLFQIPQADNYFILSAYENGSVVLWSITINQIDSPLKDDDKRIVVDQLWNCKEHVESGGYEVEIIVEGRRKRKCVVIHIFVSHIFLWGIQISVESRYFG